MPGSLFNKAIMMQSNTFEEATVLAKNSHPANSFNLTIACKKDVHSFSYYQGEDDNTYICKLSDLNDIRNLFTTKGLMDIFKQYQLCHLVFKFSNDKDTFKVMTKSNNGLEAYI
jgi:hypothetical protein